MRKPTAVVVGFIGKLPFAGMSLYNLHYIAGLHDLGYDVHYVERQNLPDELYDPVADAMTDDPGFAIRYLGDLLPSFGVAREQFTFIDRHDNCHCTSRSALRDAINRAEFILTLCDRTWYDDFARCPRRAFVDGDPVFTQAAMLDPDGKTAALLSNYDTLFTYATRIGSSDCTVPAASREWIATRPVVATRYWNVSRASESAAVTALARWTGGRDVTLDGAAYGYKNRELMRFKDLPRRTSRRFAMAVSGDAPIDELRGYGWELVDPLESSRTIAAYHEFIATSRADLGIVKHAYMASSCGWFSDRSTCYLAAGRPVLHQETGFSDWLPAGNGVFPFSSIEEIVEALECLDSDYDGHSRAARKTAEEHFEAATVVGRMLDDCGYR